MSTYWTSVELSLNSTLEAEDYVRNCYSKERSSTTILDCGKLHTQIMPFDVEHNATCPFTTGICRYDSQSAFGMDTGKVPFTTLGLNCRRCHELSFRRQTVCAPLRSGQLFMGTAGEGGPEDEGAIWVWSFFRNETSGQNETYSVELNWDKPGFKLRSMNLGSIDPAYLQEPLRHESGDHNPVLILITVNMGLQFRYKVDDPIFSIQGDIEPERLPDPDWPWRYRSNQLLSVIGCDEQIQYCSLKTGRCTEMRGVIVPGNDTQITQDFSVLAGNTSRDDEAFKEILPAAVLVDNLLTQSTIQGSISDRDGNAALQAARTLQNDRVSAPLDREQWKIELREWFSVAMARLQLGVFATIERRPDVDPNRVRNIWDEHQKTLCGSVKYKSPNHTSLSFFGVMFVVVGAVLLLAVSFFEFALGRVLKGWLGERMGVWEGAENLRLLEERKGLRGG